MKNTSRIDSILQSRKVIITSGTGGVGKTTVSAALGIRAAQLGKKTIVFTIDPAKRLATSLGLEKLGDEAMDLTPQLRDRLPSSPSLSGQLFALMPDTRNTLKDLFESISPNQKIYSKLVDNPIFQILGRDFSGANEYMALHQLDSLYSSEEYDCIILDTPPSRNTQAFLNAPYILAKLFEEKTLQIIAGKTGRLFSGGVEKLISTFEKLTGSGFSKELFSFLKTLLETEQTFMKKLKRIAELFESTNVGFLLVTTPSPETGNELEGLQRAIQEKGFSFDGLILNRCLSTIEIDRDSPFSNKISPKAYDLVESIQIREKWVNKRLVDTLTKAKENGKELVCEQIPELNHDVHSIEDLIHVAQALTPISAPS